MQFQDKNADKQIKMFSRMLHGHPHGIVVINQDFKICSVNKKIVEKTGYTPVELYGEHVNILLDELKHEAHLEHLKKWFQHPVHIPLNRRGQLYINTQKGNHLKVKIDVYSIEDWDHNGMFQTSEVVKPTLFGCAAIVFEDE